MQLYITAVIYEQNIQYNFSPKVAHSSIHTHRLELFSECRISIINRRLVSAQLVSTQINDAPMETIDHGNTK